MHKTFHKIVFLSRTLLLLCALIACQPNVSQPPSTSTFPPNTPNLNLTCADLDAAWGNNWPLALQVIDQLIASNQTCGVEPLASKKYAAHFNYAVALENGGQPTEAIEHYQAAFNLDPHRREAWEALVRLNSLPPPTPTTCLPESEILNTPYPSPSADSAQYLSVQNRLLILGSHEFHIRGVNYYPRLTPWYRFLKETKPEELSEELNLIRQAGFNTLRVFLWYDMLFTCQPEDAVPIANSFAIVDSVLTLAHEHGLKVILTLNDLPDLTYRPLYTDWARYDAQTIFIVRRYKAEPAILAWDLRNEGDLDYGAQSPLSARFNQKQVLDWLSHLSQLVKENAPHHLITAGWWGDPVPTSPAVDFLSFHHWYDAQQLLSRIRDYRSRTDQPLLLQEVGYHSWSEAPVDARGENTQAELLQQVTLTAETQGLLGWMIWTAFDFAPPPGQTPTNEHFFGIWHLDLSAKPALSALPLN